MSTDSAKPLTPRGDSQPPQGQAETVTAAFHWNQGGKEVFLIGSFSNWKERFPMDFDGKIFTKTIALPPGVHAYKFIVDGEWHHAEDQQSVSDELGNVNNVVSLTVPTRPSLHLPQNWAENLPDQPHDGLHEPKGSPRNKPLKNQFLISGVFDGTEEGGDTTAQLTNRKLLLVMVGLPARGKSFVSMKLARYLTWLGYKCKVFNLGQYRREALGGTLPEDFFSPDNADSTALRHRLAERAVEDLLEYLRHGGGNVAILDGTNSTVERRRIILQKVKANKRSINGSVKTIFIELLCSDPQISQNNIQSTRLTSPDYVGKDPEQALADFQNRISCYEATYQTVTDEVSYIKIFDVGRQMVTNRIHGFLPSRLAFFLNNLHTAPRPIYFSRHGESEYNVYGKLGGDPPLTERGMKYAEALRNFIKNPPEDETDYPHFDPATDLCVWSSTMKRAVQTSTGISGCQFVRWKSLEEINVGICDGFTEAEVKEKYPEEWKARQQNKLTYRYPRGESYEDVIRRLEPVIIELERQRKPVLVVAHRAVLRCLIAYFKDVIQEELPYLSVPLHTVIKLYPRAYGTVERQYKLVETVAASGDQNVT